MVVQISFCRVFFFIVNELGSLEFGIHVRNSTMRLSNIDYVVEAHYHQSMNATSVLRPYIR